MVPWREDVPVIPVIFLWFTRMKGLVTDKRVNRMNDRDMGRHAYVSTAKKNGKKTKRLKRKVYRGLLFSTAGSQE